LFSSSKIEKVISHAHMMVFLRIMLIEIPHKTEFAIPIHFIRVRIHSNEPHCDHL
jgi:hypothetical protein